MAQKYAHLALPGYEMGCFRRWLLENGYGAQRWIEHHTSKGIDPLLLEVKWRESYASFYPKDFVMNELASFEYYPLKQDGGTSKIQEKLRHGLGSFKGWGMRWKRSMATCAISSRKMMKKPPKMAGQAGSGESSGAENSEDSLDTSSGFSGDTVSSDFEDNQSVS